MDEAWLILVMVGSLVSVFIVGCYADIRERTAQLDVFLHRHERWAAEERLHVHYEIRAVLTVLEDAENRDECPKHIVEAWLRVLANLVGRLERLGGIVPGDDTKSILSLQKRIDTMCADYGLELSPSEEEE